jgi:cytochrome c2
MMNRVFGLLSLLLVFLVLAGVSAMSSEAPDGEKLTQERCAQCHNLVRVERAKDMKDRVGWERTVDRMIGKRPGLLSADERAAVINYLVKE